MLNKNNTSVAIGKYETGVYAENEGEYQPAQTHEPIRASLSAYRRVKDKTMYIKVADQTLEGLRILTVPKCLGEIFFHDPLHLLAEALNSI